jgi:hypothetical protein
MSLEVMDVLKNKSILYISANSYLIITNPIRGESDLIA